jgi:F-type H+-transporting ATPase subunit gamma
MALKLIKNKIRATQRTGKVTKAMEAVSAVKMRKSQERALSGRTYARAALRVLARLSATGTGKEHPYAKGRDGERTLFIAITSDKGLAGNVNSAVLKLLEAEIRESDKEKLSFITFGRKATDYLTNRGYAVMKSYVNVSDEVSLTDMHEVVALAAAAFAAMECDRVAIVYQNFLSTFEQKPAIHQLLPLKEETLRTIVKGIRPARGKFADEGEEGKAVLNYTIEPDPEEIIALLVPQLLEIMVYHALLESKASEHSARMVAMKNATEKAKEMTKSLTIKFNKERQAVITREVSEITGGIEAMAQK